MKIAIALYIIVFVLFVAQVLCVMRGASPLYLVINGACLIQSSFIIWTFSK